jgi:hypothetical protein
MLGYCGSQEQLTAADTRTADRVENNMQSNTQLTPRPERLSHVFSQALSTFRGTEHGKDGCEVPSDTSENVKLQSPALARAKPNYFRSAKSQFDLAESSPQAPQRPRFVSNRFLILFSNESLTEQSKMSHPDHEADGEQSWLTTSSELPASYVQPDSDDFVKKVQNSLNLVDDFGPESLP